MEILPAVDILEGRAVRLAKGDYSKVTVYNESPLEQARIFEQAGAAWLHVVDLDGARTGIPHNIEAIKNIASNTSLQVEVGGGIRNLETIEQLMQAGVSRVVLGTSLVRDPDFAQAAIERYGDRLAAGIDAKAGEVAVEGWCEGSGITTEALIEAIAKMGFRHLVYTDIARDGMQTGIDAQAYAAIAKLFGSPVIASGGVADLNDIKQLGKISSSIEGVIAGRAIYEGTLNLQEALEIA